MYYLTNRHYFLLLLSLAFAQCKCHVQPNYDTTRAELLWSNQPQTLATTDFTLPAEGLTCFVPGNAQGQGATYFLSVCGKAWQFTQEKDGALAVKTLPRLQPFDKAAAFVFAAGSSANTNLYFGQISHSPAYAYQLNKYSDVQVDLKKYDGTQWHKQNPQSLMVATPYGQSLMPITPSSQPNNFPCTGCTFRKGTELWGCCMLPVAYTTSAGNAPAYASACFVFDPMAQAFVPCMPTLLLSKNNTQRLVTGLELEEPGKLVFLEEKVADSTPVLAMTGDLPQELPLKIHNPFSAHQDWASFSLCIDQDLSVIMPIFTSTSGNLRHFYQVDKTASRLEPVKSTAVNLPGDSLVLPFANCVYVLTKGTDSQAGDIVYYKGECKISAT